MLIEAMQDHSQPHVLVVDDDLIMRGAARRVPDRGWVFGFGGENGVQAIAALENLRPDIILMM